MDPQILQLLQSLEKSREQFWNISPEVGNFLYETIIKNDYSQILEIGSSNGYSGIWIASALSKLQTPNKATLYTIESHKERFALSKENFEKSGLNKFIIHINGHAPECIPTNKNFDLAFFDATKYEHESYYQTIKDNINIGGIIIADNIHSHKDQMNSYIEALKNDKNFDSKESTLGTGLLISKKIS